MANMWIKLYIEALHDRKMRKLHRFDKSVFYDLLLLAGQEDKDGMLPDIADIALELDLKATEAKKSINALLQAGLLSKDDNDNVMITNFKKRQESNTTAYERVKRYRDNKRDNANDNADDNAMITQPCYQNVINDNADDNANDTEMITVDKELRIKNIEEEKELNILTADAVEVLPAPKPIDWKRAFGPEAGRAQAFSEITGITPIKSEFGRWQKDLKAFTEAGISIDQMKTACAYMKREKLTIGAPGSLFKIARSLKNANPTDPQTVSDFPDFYSAIQALTDHPEIIDL